MAASTSARHAAAEHAAEHESHKEQWVFCYGSNHAEQLAARVERDVARRPLRVRPAHLPDHVRIFADTSKRWGGGVASVHPAPGSRVYGTVAALTSAELRKLDAFEGGYTRLLVRVALDDEEEEPGQLLESHVYIMNNPRFRRLPSPAYMAAIRRQLDGRGAGRTRPSEALLVRGVAAGGAVLQLGRWEPAAPGRVQRAPEHAARLDADGWWVEGDDEEEDEEDEEAAVAEEAEDGVAAAAAVEGAGLPGGQALQEGVACEA